MRAHRVLFPTGLLLVLALAAEGQAIISATAGVLQFFEGAVMIDGRPMERKAASFPAVKDGSTLQTHKGRAEILLSPGFYLRLDEESAVKMVSNSLTDTRLELLGGAAIVDSADAKPGSPVVVTYKGAQMRFPEPGVYRLDADTGVLQAYSGKADVKSADGKTTDIDDAHLYFFEIGMLTDKVTGGTEDEFYDWARDRSEALSAQNQLAAQNDGGPDDADADPNLGSGLLGPGLPPVPYATPPSYSYQAPYGSGMYFSSLLNPYYGYSAAPFGFYNSFPMVLIVRPGNGRYAWPRRTLPGVTTGYGVRTAYGSVLRPSRSITSTIRGTAPSVSHPVVTAAPHAAAVGAIHAGHR